MVQRIEYCIDVNRLSADRHAKKLAMNDIGRIRLRLHIPLLVDDYRRNEATGSLILIDPATFDTVGAGMVLPAVRKSGLSPNGERAASPNTTLHPSAVRTAERLTRGSTVWLTGLSGSGKSTVAVLAEQMFIADGRPSYVLDGDNLRHGLNADLGFSMDDRAENLRRIAHVACLMANAGIVVIVPVISPLSRHRADARRLHEEQGIEFFEVHMATPLAICEERDPKGLYRRARAGEIRDFTGIDSPYEEPESPDLRLLPGTDAATNSAAVVEMVVSRDE